jgi:hypothetical protein
MSWSLFASAGARTRPTNFFQTLCTKLTWVTEKIRSHVVCLFTFVRSWDHPSYGRLDGIENHWTTSLSSNARRHQRHARCNQEPNLPIDPTVSWNLPHFERLASRTAKLRAHLPVISKRERFKIRQYLKYLCPVKSRGNSAFHCSDGPQDHLCQTALHVAAYPTWPSVDDDSLRRPSRFLSQDAATARHYPNHSLFRWVAFHLFRRL